MIEFDGIRNQGEHNKERVVFRIVEDGNIGSIMMHRALARIDERGERRIKNIVYETFWFPDVVVCSGELAIVYTKSGIFHKEKINDKGKKSHFFYWGRKVAQWSIPNTAVLFGKFSEWTGQFCEIERVGDADAET